VTSVVRRYQGRLTVRSGSDRVFFPGTLVGISFSQRS